MYFLRDFRKAEVDGETLTAFFGGGCEVRIRLQPGLSSLLLEVKEYIEEAVKLHKRWSCLSFLAAGGWLYAGSRVTSRMGVRGCVDRL